MFFWKVSQRVLPNSVLVTHFGPIYHQQPASIVNHADVTAQEPAVTVEGLSGLFSVLFGRVSTRHHEPENEKTL